MRFLVFVGLKMGEVAVLNVLLHLAEQHFDFLGGLGQDLSDFFGRHVCVLLEDLHVLEIPPAQKFDCYDLRVYESQIRVTSAEQLIRPVQFCLRKRVHQCRQLENYTTLEPPHILQQQLIQLAPFLTNYSASFGNEVEVRARMFVEGIHAETVERSDELVDDSNLVSAMCVIHTGLAEKSVKQAAVFHAKVLNPESLVPPSLPTHKLRILLEHAGKQLMLPKYWATNILPPSKDFLCKHRLHLHLVHHPAEIVRHHSYLILQRPVRKCHYLADSLSLPHPNLFFPFLAESAYNHYFPLAHAEPILQGESIFALVTEPPSEPDTRHWKVQNRLRKRCIYREPVQRLISEILHKKCVFAKLIEVGYSPCEVMLEN